MLSPLQVFGKKRSATGSATKECICFFTQRGNGSKRVAVADVHFSCEYVPIFDSSLRDSLQYLATLLASSVQTLM